MMRLIWNQKEIDINELLTKKIDYLRDNGVREQSIIAISLSNNLDIIILWMACDKLNCVPLFLPIYFDENTVNYVFSNIQVNYWIKENSVEPITKEVLYKKYDIKPHYIIHTTSATEGMPKIIIRSDKEIYAEMTRYIKKLNVTCDDVIMPILPMYHSYGFLCGFMLAYYLEATLVLCMGEYPKKIINAIDKFNVTIMLSVPQVYRMLLCCNNINFNNNLRYCISSSASLGTELANEFFDKYKCHLTQLLGSSETGCLAFSSSQNGINVFDEIFDGVYFSLDDEKKLFVESYETKGTYVKNNKVEKDNGRPFCMGEKAEIDKKGFVKILGRKDKVLNISGRKISYDYIINKIKNYTGIDDIKIVLVDKGNINEIEYHVIPNDGFNKKEFIDYLNSCISSWLHPQRIVCVESLKTWKNNNE